MKSKKSMEWALTAVGVAVLVLAVVVVSLLIFSGGSRKFAQTISSCEQNGGRCVGATDCDTTTLSFECAKPKICCARSTGFV